MNNMALHNIVGQFVLLLLFSLCSEGATYSMYQLSVSGAPSAYFLTLVNGGAPPFSLLWQPANICDDNQLFTSVSGVIYPKVTQQWNTQDPSYNQIKSSVVVINGVGNVIAASPDGYLPASYTWGMSNGNFMSQDGRYMFFSYPAQSGSFSLSSLAVSALPPPPIVVKTAVIAPPPNCHANCSCYGDPHVVRFDNGRITSTIPDIIPLASCKGLEVYGLTLSCGTSTTLACTAGVTVFYGIHKIDVYGPQYDTLYPWMFVDDTEIYPNVNDPPYVVDTNPAITFSRPTETLYQINTPDGVVVFTSYCPGGASINVSCVNGPILNTDSSGTSWLCADTTDPSLLQIPSKRNEPKAIAATGDQLTRAVKRTVNPADACKYVSSSSPIGTVCGSTQDWSDNCVMDVGNFNNLQCAAPIVDEFMKRCPFIPPLIASALQTYVVLPSLIGIQVGATLLIQIVTRTAWGDPKTTCFPPDDFGIAVGNNLIVPLPPPASQQVLTCTSGVWSAAVVLPLTPGTYSVFVLQYYVFHIFGSPFTVTVHELPSLPSLTYAFGPGTFPLALLYSGVTRCITIQAVSSNGPRTTGGENVTYSITGGTTKSGAATDNGNGSYTICYAIPFNLLVVTVIKILIAGVQISGCPINILSIL